MRHPAALGERDVAQFLSSLAVERGVSASAQNQARRRSCFRPQANSLGRRAEGARPYTRPRYGTQHLYEVRYRDPPVCLHLYSLGHGREG